MLGSKTKDTLIYGLGSLFLALNLAWLIYVDSQRADLYQTTDFLTAFYTAGYAITHNALDSLYPAKDVTTYYQCAFDNLSHSLLPLLPKPAVSNYQYTPLTTLVFAPFALLDPTSALVAWQIASILALAASCYFLARYAGINPLKLFLISFAFFPVFHMLKLGQCGIQFGLLPITMGLYFLHREKPLPAGLSFSLCILSPKFVPVVALISFCLLFMKNKKTLAGLVFGSIALVAVSFALLPANLWKAWAESMHLAEKYYLFEAEIHHRMYYYVSLPAIVLQSLPQASRASAKLAIYGFSAVLCSHALYLCIRISLSTLSKEMKLACLTTIALFLMPLVEPHLIYYDMIGLLIVVVLFWQDFWPSSAQLKLRALAAAIVLLLDVDLLLFAFINREWVNPLLVVLALGGFYLQFVFCCRDFLYKEGPPSAVSL